MRLLHFGTVVCFHVLGKCFGEFILVPDPLLVKATKFAGFELITLQLGGAFGGSVILASLTLAIFPSGFNSRKKIFL